MKVFLIVAMAKNRVIGESGKILWHLPADFRHFKTLTMGHPIVMGRKTWESLGKPLPGRDNIVISRNPSYVASGARVFPSFEGALKAFQGTGEIFVIGGGEIYKLALPYAEKIYLTLVDCEPAGDVFFPELDENIWLLQGSERHLKDEKNAYDYEFRIYVKTPNR